MTITFDWKMKKRQVLPCKSEVIGYAVTAQRASLVGIYYLIEDQEVVYVGQSHDLHMRINTHLREREKDFDRYYLHIIFDDSNIDEIEAHEIIKYDPKYNRYIHPNKAYASMPKLKALLHAGAVEIKNHAKQNDIQKFVACGKDYYRISDFSDFGAGIS